MAESEFLTPAELADLEEAKKRRDAKPRLNAGLRAWQAERRALAAAAAERLEAWKKSQRSKVDQ